MDEMIKYLKALTFLQLQSMSGGSAYSRPEFLLHRAGFKNREIAELLGKKEDAKSSFKLSSEQTLRENNYIRYYQGLSLLKLGNKTKAAEYFNSLISEGDKQIKQGSEVDFFAKFGERESENVRLSNAYLLKGLGYKGLGKTDEAKENLKKAEELSASNLYAKVEME